jgi:heterodisulfide reductase subunit C
MSKAQGYALMNEKAGRINPKFKYEISEVPGAERIMLCFQCGTCTAGCPISRFSEFYNPRKIARMVQLGLKDRLLSNDALWLCTTCYTCIDSCPQGVEVAGIVRALRNLSVKEKRLMPRIYEELASNLLKTGYVYVIPRSRLNRRKEQGLPPLPKSNIEHVAKIFKVTGFSKILDGVKTFNKAKAED